MLETTDLIHLPYTPDLTEGGITFACRTLAGSAERGGDPPLVQLRRCVSEVAVELAFRRHMTEQSVPFHVLGMTPFTQPNHYDISLGGHRFIVKSYLISQRDQITLLHRDPGSILKAPALIPLDQFATEDHKPDDIYIFAILLGLVAAKPEDVRKASAASQPLFLIHLLPKAWARPASWMPLPKLSLKSECEVPVEVDIGGLDGGRNFVTARLELPPRQRILVDMDFHSLTYIHAGRRPEARIGIHSPLQGHPYLIPAHAWGNLWVYGMEIILTGWLTHEVLHNKAKVINPGMRTFQFDRIREKNLLVPVSDLNPLGRLLDKVRQWETERMVSRHPEMEKRS
jgi:hypothetical protein